RRHMADFADRVLKLVAEPDYKPSTLKALSRRLRLGAEEYADFRAAVKRLIKEGRLDVAKDKKLSKPSVQGAIVGVFRRSSKGFGFVRPHPAQEKVDQIYIPADASRDASSGDEVVVKVSKRPKAPGLNAEGKIVQILARASAAFVGTYFEDGDAGYVKVD